MIAEAAYFRAEHQAFQGANLERDWLESEVEIDNLLASQFAFSYLGSAMNTATHYIHWFRDITVDDVPLNA